MTFNVQRRSTISALRERVLTAGCPAWGREEGPHREAARVGDAGRELSAEQARGWRRRRRSVWALKPSFETGFPVRRLRASGGGETCGVVQLRKSRFTRPRCAKSAPPKAALASGRATELSKNMHGGPTRRVWLCRSPAASEPRSIKGWRGRRPATGAPSYELRATSQRMLCPSSGSPLAARCSQLLLAGLLASRRGGFIGLVQGPSSPPFERRSYHGTRPHLRAEPSPVRSPRPHPPRLIFAHISGRRSPRMRASQP